MNYEMYLRHLDQYPAFLYEGGDLGFTYLRPEDPGLSEFAKRYSLDQIPGQGEALPRVLRLMDWVHRELNHLGERVSIQPLSPLVILETARSLKPSLFCYHKAIVLTDALLAVGIPARRLTCLPRVFDGDCHVVSMAFLRELGIWAVFDPTFNTYFHDDSGVPLGVHQIREAYRERRAPRFRSIGIKKDWALFMDGHECQTYDEWYEGYMAKNCFRFYCPQASHYGEAGSDKERFVLLDPVGYEGLGDNQELDIACRTYDLKGFNALPVGVRCAPL